jgi:hypothetical protein
MSDELIPYRVEWSAVILAHDPIEAAKEAWSELNYATNSNSGSTLLFVEKHRGDGSDRVSIDMLNPLELEYDPRTS